MKRARSINDWSTVAGYIPWDTLGGMTTNFMCSQWKIGCPPNGSTVTTMPTGGSGSGTNITIQQPKDKNEKAGMDTTTVLLSIAVVGAVAYMFMSSNNDQQSRPVRRK